MIPAPGGGRWGAASRRALRASVSRVRAVCVQGPETEAALWGPDKPSIHRTSHGSRVRKPPRKACGEPWGV